LPGSTLSVVVSGFLTIFIALVGYNLLLGGSLTIRSGTVSMLKVGAVLALATSWPAYRTLVYNLAVDGPSQIIADIANPSGVPASDAALPEQLDTTDAQLVRLAIDGVGVGIRDDISPPPFAGFNAFALGGSRILYLITAIGGLGLVRITTGLMLALGPFFIAFLLFDSTRSLFEGWVRVLAGAALGTVGISIALSFELLLLNQWLADLLIRRMAGEDLPTVPVELFVLTCAFSLIAFGALFASARIARAFRLAIPWPAQVVAGVALQGRDNETVLHAPAVAQGDRNRAAAIADVLVSLQSRESRGRIHPNASGPRGASTAFNTAQSGGLGSSVGRSFNRRAHARQTTSSGKRDQL
jgi:type IV secretion system protein VirB6